MWKNIGGLPGTALTIQDVGVPEITLHGPTGLVSFTVQLINILVVMWLHSRMKYSQPQRGLWYLEI